MMKMHHQMALDMSQTQIASGKSAELKAMAEQIIKDSRRDIDKIEKWMSQKK